MLAHQGRFPDRLIVVHPLTFDTSPGLPHLSRLLTLAVAAPSQCRSQVAHLFTEPARAYTELARVLRPRSPLIINPGNLSRSDVEDRLRARLDAAMQIERSATRRSREAAIADLVAQVSVAGFDAEQPIEMSDRVTRVIGETIETLVKNPFGWGAMLKRPRVARAAKHVRSWAIREFGSLESSYDVDLAMTFLVLRRRTSAIRGSFSRPGRRGHR